MIAKIDSIFVDAESEQILFPFVYGIRKSVEKLKKKNRHIQAAFVFDLVKSTELRSSA